jgi:hypothetical protein
MGYFAKGTGYLTISSSNISKISLSVQMLVNETPKGFAWVDSKNLSKACKDRDLIKIFSEWGFSISYNEKTETYNLDFDNKIRDEEILLKRIAPFVKRGEICWKGEDGNLWKNEFKEGNFRTLNGFVDYK